MEGIGNVGVSGGHLVGLTGPAIRGEGMLQFDDMGLDEYDVADERQHEIGFDRWEINPDNMTYEELLQLQARIGYVNKGLDLDRIKSFPQMTKMELQKFLKKQQQTSKAKTGAQNVRPQQPNDIVEESKQPSNHNEMHELQSFERRSQ